MFTFISIDPAHPNGTLVSVYRQTASKFTYEFWIHGKPVLEYFPYNAECYPEPKLIRIKCTQECVKEEMSILKPIKFCPVTRFR
jgi:hypothetical protein